MNQTSDIEGFLVVNKPSGWTSFDVVAKIRNKLGVKKVGHTGTLDPMATGVLVLCLGKATKKAQEMTGLDKEYIGEVTLGVTSNTDDAEGEITPFEDAKETSREEIEAVLEQFKGEIEQMPPWFSAKKVGGHRAYKMARKGETVELKPAQVRIDKIEILEYRWPVLSLRIECGKGTYIRALARDIGQALGTGGMLSALTRNRVGDFRLEGAVDVGQAEESSIIPLNRD